MKRKKLGPSFSDIQANLSKARKTNGLIGLCIAVILVPMAINIVTTERSRIDPRSNHPPLRIAKELVIYKYNKRNYYCSQRIEDKQQLLDCRKKGITFNFPYNSHNVSCEMGGITLTQVFSATNVSFDCLPSKRLHPDQNLVFRLRSLNNINNYSIAFTSRTQD